MYHIKSNVINEYDPVCNITKCYICMNTFNEIFMFRVNQHYLLVVQLDL